jgi:hypothetical protein
MKDSVAELTVPVQSVLGEQLTAGRAAPAK